MNALPPLNANLLIAYGGVFAVLIVGSGVTRYLTRTSPERDYTELRLRVRTWWLIVPPLIVALTWGPWAVTLLFAAASGIALREYLALTGAHRHPPRVLALAYLAVPIQFLLAHGASDAGFFAFVPLCCLLLAGVALVARGRNFQHEAASLAFGLMLAVFSLSHIARLGTLVGGTGLVIFLLMVTQLNDVSQYVSGKLFGKTPLAPTLSPAKTREGMFGGLVVSVALAALLGPLLTPLPVPVAALTGVVLALAGVAGDLTISAIKRAAGAKDTGRLLPGHGGLLDRVDSLIYAAPVFFYGVLAWRGGP